MIVDIVVAVIVIASALISFMRGFIREVLTIAGVVGGIVAAIFFGPPMAPTVRTWFGVEEGSNPEDLFGVIPMEFVADAVTYGAIFIAVVVVIYILTHFISGAAKAVGLGPVDRTLGVVFGIARALVLLGLLYMPLNVLIPKDKKEELFEGSQTHFIVEEVSTTMASYLPEMETVTKEADGHFKKKLEDSAILAGEKKEENAKPAEKPPEEGYGDQEREEIEKLFNDPAASATNQ